MVLEGDSHGISQGPVRCLKEIEMVAELSRKAESPLLSDRSNKVGSCNKGSAGRTPKQLRNWQKPPIHLSRNRSSSSPHQGVRGTRGSQAHFREPRNHLQG